MEKYKNLVRIEEMKNLLSEGNYRRALEIAQQIDIRKLKKSSELNLVYEVYMRNSRYERARACVERLYSKVSTRKILMQLIEVCLKLHDVASASEYQQEFISMAPDDFYRYIYQYNIDKLSGKPVEVLIDDLEQLKELEYIDIWAYELAKLYHKAGLRDKCMKECDDIVVWFGDGDIVDRAKALRAYYNGELELEGREETAGDAETFEGEAEDEATEAVEGEAHVGFEIEAAESAAGADEGFEGEADESAADAEKGFEGEADESVADADEGFEGVAGENEGFESEGANFGGEGFNGLNGEEEAFGSESFDGLSSEEEGTLEVTSISAEPVTAEAMTAASATAEPVTEEAVTAASDLHNEDIEEDVFKKDEPVDIKIDSGVIDGDDYDFSSSLASMVGMLMDEDEQSAFSGNATTESEVHAESELTTFAENEATENVETAAAPEPAEAEDPADPASAALSEREIAEIEVEQALTSMIEEETRIANGEDTTHLGPDEMFGPMPAPATGSLLAKLLDESECELSDFLGGFSFVEPVRTQFFKCMDIMLDSKYKNRSLIVSGSSTRERTMISRCVIKTLYMADILKEQRIAKTTGVKANSVNILGGNAHIKNCGLMIDVAGGIDGETAKKLVSFRDVYGPSSLIVLMDTKNELNRIFREYDDLAAAFTNRIHIPELKADDLCKLALWELYAAGFDIERSAAVELKKKIEGIASGADALSSTLDLVDRIKDRIETGNARMLIESTLKGETLSGGSQTVTKNDVTD
ncbi:MAG: hypothetical protein ILP10_07740 [Lachnospiraceae bacterium]|nr:hypothetical protein [Lachnospiraceae bacterium]